MIFHRRARQAKAVARGQAADYFGGVRVGVFDVLRFVKHHQVPVLRLPALAVAQQQRVRRHHNVVLAHAGGPAMPLVAVQYQHAEFRRKACRFAVPVAHQADGCHHQHRQVESASVFFRQDVGQRLQRFAEAHVVGQNAAKPVAAQKLQPAQAFKLVGAQGGLQVGRCVNVRQIAAACQLADGFTQFVSAFPAGFGLLVVKQRRTDAQRLKARQAQ